MTETKDTLTINWQLIQEFDDDYDQEFALKEEKEFKFQGFTPFHFNESILDYVTLFFIITFLLGVIAFIVYHYTGTTYKRDLGKIIIPEEDTIYGVDFEASLKAVEQDGDYYQSIRLRYLWLLSILNDKHLINWAPQRAPEEYVYEYNKPEMRESTNIFLKIRYGNYEATKELDDESKRLFLILTDGKEVNHD